MVIYCIDPDRIRERDRVREMGGGAGTDKREILGLRDKD